MASKAQPLIYLPETDSTNRYLQVSLDSEMLTDGTVVWTDFQTAGRGQPGNSWESEKGKNLLFSLLYYPEQLPANQPFIIAELAALSVRRTLEQFISGVSVKWPNDIYRDDQKICGILIENTISSGQISRSVIGIGLNLNQERFCSEAPNPVSLKQLTGETYDRRAFLKELCTTFQTLRLQLEAGGAAAIHDEYTQSLYRKTGFHRYRDAAGDFEAQIHHIELSGHLVLARRDGTLSKYAFKEVSCLINN